MSVDGNWKVTIKSPMGAMATRLTIKSKGNAFTGTQSGQGQSTDVIDGKVDGNTITWSNNITVPLKITLQYSGVVSDGEMSGKVKAGLMGSFTFSGVRED
jgi:hypothetical protein